MKYFGDCNWLKASSQIMTTVESNLKVKDDDDDYDCQSYSFLKRFPRKKKLCGNCGESGHFWKQCSQPITSYGLCAFRINPDDVPAETFRDELGDTFADGGDDEATKRILLVQRKDTMGFVDFLRGRYSSIPEKRDRQIRTFFSEMTIEEREKLQSTSSRPKEEVFDSLWKQLWINHRSKSFLNEYNPARDKFMSVNIGYYLENTSSNWKYTEWGLPKGRRNKSETNLSCAEREFREESGYSKKDYCVLDADAPIIELFHGTNCEEYKHIYYLAHVFPAARYPEINLQNSNQAGEIRHVGWFTEKQALYLIRDYDEEKKKIISHVFEKIKNYSKPEQQNSEI